jgi:hypothetical protein
VGALQAVQVNERKYLPELQYPSPVRLGALVALSLLIAGMAAYLIMALWQERKALIFLLYFVYIMGVAGWMPTRTPLGYSVSVGVAIGFVIPLAVWLVQGAFN